MIIKLGWVEERKDSKKVTPLVLILINETEATKLSVLSVS